MPGVLFGIPKFSASIILGVRLSEPAERLEYLVIGHVTQDLGPDGLSPGGTTAYASLTAQALGWHAGIVTSLGPSPVLGPVADIPTACIPAAQSTVFENRYGPQGRSQRIRSLAARLDITAVPRSWLSPRIVHLGPVAGEVDPGLVHQFQNAFIGVTPQGWLRAWNAEGTVQPGVWAEAEGTLRAAHAAVLSLEDVQGQEDMIDDFVHDCPVLAVTEGAHGARVYWNTHLRRFAVPPRIEVDPTGAGDIFAVAFFIRLAETRDPYVAGRFATRLAAASVTRRGLRGVPTPPEIAQARVEVC